MESEVDQVGLLDLLLVLAENAKLLLLGPVVVGLAALSISYALPQKFVSEAILAIPTSTSPGAQSAAQAASLMRSPLVLDPVVTAFDLAQGRSVNQARQEFAEDVKASVAKDGLLRLAVTGPSAAQSQALANAVIDAWVKTTKPAEQDRKDIETRLNYAKTSLDGVSALLARLSKESANYLAQPLSRGEAGTTLASVGELQARYVNEVLNLSRSLQGLSRDVVVQPPTVPTEHVSPKKSLIAILAALATGFALLVWVFVRKSWQSLATQPEAAAKLGRLRAAFKSK
jgi:capsular polysaccharide biosynthesis protein